jgi:hypothetical protein
VGTARILLCVRLDFIEDMSASDVERACVDLSRELRAEFADLDEVFIEPVPRGEPEVRQRVVDRYGTNLAE